MQVKSRATFFGFLVSVAVHAAVIAAIFLNETTEVVQSTRAPQSVTISLSSMSEVAKEIPEKKVCKKPKKEHKEHKKVAHKKPKKVHKAKAEPKKVVQKETVLPVQEPIVEEKVSVEPVEEIVQQELEEQILEEQKKLEQELQEQLAAREQQKREQEAQELAQSLHEEFVKTNFEIIRDMVLSNLNYPRIAKRMGFEGVVEIMLVIDTSGKLLEVVLQNSSGHEILDKSALKAANSLASKVLPNPKNISKISLPVYFALR